MQEKAGGKYFTQKKKLYYLDKLLPQTQLEHQPFTHNDQNEKCYLEGL